MPRIQNVALDGYVEIANPADQQQILSRLKRLGIDTGALIRMLYDDPDRRRLLREIKAVSEHPIARWHEQQLRGELAKWRHLRAAYRELERDAPADVLAEEATVTTVLHRVSAQVRRDDPRVLARQRREAARGTAREHLHHMIAAGPKDAKAVRRPGALLRGIRTWYMPAVIRLVVEQLNVARADLHRRELKVLADASWSGAHDDPRCLKMRRTEAMRRVSTRLNKLTAEFVRAFYPFWGGHVKPAHVRNAIKNSQQSRRRPAR